MRSKGIPYKHDKHGHATCVFCGGSSTTKEHVWANWLKPYIPRKSTKTAHYVSMNKVDRSIFHQEKGDILKGKLHGPGDSHSKKLKIACWNCNSGWMGKIQEEVKPILIPLIGDEWSHLSPDQQLILAKWAVMFTMVVEHAHPATCATPYSQRDHFRSSGKIPNDWAVWIAPFDGKSWNGGFNHFGMCAVRPDIALSMPLEPPPKPNVQSTAFVLRKIFFLTFSSTAAAFTVDALDFGRRHGIACIWPNQGVVIARPDNTLDYATADRLSAAFLAPGTPRRKIGKGVFD